MKSKDLVSIIVPVYKVEEYLRECVESLIVQTHKNIEIILVDDKSPDKSGVLCDELAKSDERIRVIHKPQNEGLNMARKTGFDASRGRYITFLDSDDYFCKDTVERSLKILRESHADVALFGSREFSDVDERVCERVGKRVETKTISTKKEIADYAFHGGGNLPGIQYVTVWGKLYTRKVVEGVDWKAANYRAYEDNFWTPQALLGADKVVLMANHLIHYRRNVAYGADSMNLGNKLTGNSINGQPVGYIELIELIYKFYSKLARKNGLGSKLSEQTIRQLFLIKSWRVDNLAAAGLTGTENNMKFIIPFLDEYIRAKNGHIANLDANIKHLRDIYSEKDAMLAHLSQTLEELHGIRRSAKLLMGNIKRKIIK